MKGDGSRCSGQIQISWQSYYDYANTFVAAGSTQTPVTNGIFSIALDTGLVNGSNPNGYAYYQVSYNLTPTGCNPAPEQWLLYFSGTPLNLANVRTLNLPIGFTLVPLAWLAQDGATNTQCIVWSGNTWAPGSCGGGGGGGNYYNTISVTQPPYNADPTGATDSTAAIAAACAAAKVLGGASTFGSTLFFPPGRYKTDTITCLSSGGTGMTFQGAGGQSSWLVSLSGNDLIAIQHDRNRTRYHHQRPPVSTARRVLPIAAST